ncbi:MAG TPA: asparagine synthase (glutamine-hydrolyzing) [Candidatus Acidoferrales bacterium]|nr:asparagine synthase (glutamine-hydrolyzing) [Candidatus Acidoferrales bacterium]
MCGIAGIVSTELGARQDVETIRLMCSAIAHRGPDDDGFYLHDGAGLGMRRLSIIDLTGGHQPIHNEDRNVWVVFNGEIYNFPDLRRGLESRGHNFYTHSDTEVIVHLYEEFGADCVQKLRGMFAIALWDERRNTLVLARDRLGKKPLHYALHNDNLYFGSEIKSLLAVAPELADVDHEAMLSYFQFGYLPDPLTAFRKIRKLPPGHLLEFEAGQIRMRSYWDLPSYGTFDLGSEHECLDELERRLEEAVRIRLISDVPLGALLSGGVDSSIIVALMARANLGCVKTFSIGFPNEDFDETAHARAVAERFGTNHSEFIVDPDFSETLDKLTHMLEEPFADSSILPTYHVARLARQHINVALSGDGGDELYGGYDRYQMNLRRRVFEKIPDWVGRAYRSYAYPILPHGVRGRKFAYNISLGARDRYIDSISYLPPDLRERSIFSPDFLNFAAGCPSPAELFRNYYDRAPANDELSRMEYLDTKTYLPADVLTKVDRMSMALSLEVRCPLLDHEFVEWSASLAPHWKLRMGQSKYALKRLAERLGVPGSAIHRPKQGFAIPLVHWFRKELKSGIGHILLEPRSMARGYFNPIGVRTMLEDHWKGRRDNSGSLWILLMYELWHRNYLDPVRSGISTISETSSRATISSDPTGTLTVPSFRATRHPEDIS